MNAKKQDGRTILIASGASGGHVFPALAVAEELRGRGMNCVFVIGGDKFKTKVEGAGFKVEQLPAAPWNVKNPIRKAWAVFTLLRAFVHAMLLVNRHRPSVVFGSGGYATVALMLAGRTSGVPTMIQDQNVLPGRANRWLASKVDVVALSWAESRQYISKKAKTVVCGNPIRKVVHKAKQENKRDDDGNFRLVVLGGSMGARILSDVVPAAIALLPKALRNRLHVMQQARAEDVERVQMQYASVGFPPSRFEVRDFFDDMPQRMVNSHLVVGRSGAGTVGECALLGRAAIFVPLKLADGHQRLNASLMEDKGAAIVLYGDDFNPQALAKHLEELLENPIHLGEMEESALKISQPKAAENVANEVMKLADLDVMYLEFKEREEGVSS